MYNVPTLAPAAVATLPAHGPVELLAPGVTRQWLYNHRIVAYVISDISRPAIDAWIGGIHQAAKTWQSGQTSCSLYDFSAKRVVAFTPYLRARLTEVSQLRPELTTRVAVVLPDTRIGQLLSQMTHLFLKSQPRINTQADVFFSRDDAICWLKRQIQLE